MPAFYRAPEGSYCECLLTAGAHELELIFTKDSQFQVGEAIMVLPVALAHIQEPGPHYYLTEVLFSPVKDKNFSSSFS